MNCDMKRSISLYSYQDEYYDGKLDLEGCLRETAKTGATGVELLAEQMIKKFPLPIETEEFREQWFGWLEKYHLTPSCYDAFLENRIFDNRTLCLGEQINMMKRDIRLASLLGFHNLRTLVSTPMEVIEGSLAYAQQMDVRIGLEVHAPFSLNSGWADGYMEMIHRTGTKYFGFIPDMGIFCRNIPDVVRDKARRMGASEACIRIVDDSYAERLAKGFTKIKYDLNLGKANMEYRMANGMKETKANKIMCLVMDPKTGDILAMATNPAFNPNDATEPQMRHLHIHGQIHRILLIILIISSIHMPNSTICMMITRKQRLLFRKL